MLNTNMKLGDNRSSVFDELIFSLQKPQGGWIEDPNAPFMPEIFATSRKKCLYVDNCDDLAKNPKRSMCEPEQYICECSGGGCSSSSTMGSVCDAELGCVDMSLEEYSNGYDLDCLIPSECSDWSPDPCSTSFLGSLATRECPIDYFWACRTDRIKRTSECRSFRDNPANRRSLCYGTNSGTCFETRDECLNCDGIFYDCACKVNKPSSSSSSSSYSSSSSSFSSSSSSSCDVNYATDDTMGVCYWGMGSTTDSEEQCQPMTLGACRSQIGYGWNPNLPIPDGMALGSSVWSCGPCPGDCSPVPDCSSGSSVKKTRKRDFFGNYYYECTCSENREKCGDTQCTSCEFCYNSECISCNDPRRMNLYTSNDASCPTEYKSTGSIQGCGCTKPLVDNTIGCGDCEYCVGDSGSDSDAIKGGICYPCDDDNDGRYGIELRAQCSELCLSASKCVWEFMAINQDGVWSFANPPYSPYGCSTNPYGSDWTAVDCFTKTRKVVGQKCLTSGDCPDSPSMDIYPSLPTGPGCSSSSSQGARYNCNYEYNSQNNTTTYTCDPVGAAGDYASLESCEEQRSQAERGGQQSGQFICPRPHFTCEYSGGAFACTENITGEYYSMEECTQAIESNSCGYKYKCNAAGDGCEPDSKEGSETSFVSKFACLQAVEAGKCGKYSCTSHLNLPGTYVECEPNAYGNFNSEEECKKNCCNQSPPGSPYPEALGSCSYYTFDDYFSPLTPDNVVCETGLTESQCMAKPSVTTLAGSWSPSWNCGNDCYASQNNCPPASECPSGKYITIRTFPAGEQKCVCNTGTTPSSSTSSGNKYYCSNDRCVQVRDGSLSCWTNTCYDSPGDCCNACDCCGYGSYRDCACPSGTKQKQYTHQNGSKFCLDCGTQTPVVDGEVLVCPPPAPPQ